MNVSIIIALNMGKIDFLSKGLFLAKHFDSKILNIHCISSWLYLKIIQMHLYASL